MASEQQVQRVFIYLFMCGSVHIHEVKKNELYSGTFIYSVWNNVKMVSGRDVTLT